MINSKLLWDIRKCVRNCRGQQARTYSHFSFLSCQYLGQLVENIRAAVKNKGHQHVTIHHGFRWPVDLMYFTIYLFLGQAERLDQVPCKPRFWIKVAEHLKRLIAVINDCIQSRLSFSCSFVGLAAFSFKLTVSTHKICWTRTIVPNGFGLTYFWACSSILTRIISATAVDFCNFITGRNAVFLWN